jgi:hypothetical protein
MTSNRIKALKYFLKFGTLVFAMYIFNISLIPNFLSIIDFSTEDKKFQYRVIPQKGRDVELMELNFSDFKEKNKISSDSLRLFRTTKKEWNRVGDWYSYLTDDYWQYPYMKLR